MNKLSKTFEKIKLKTTPGSYNNIKKICTQLQAIIDRRMYNESKNKVPSYKEELNFYSIFIPDLMSRMSYNKEFDDNIKMLILQAIINAWIKDNFTKCGKIVTVFKKEFPLTTESPKSPLKNSPWSPSKKSPWSPSKKSPTKTSSKRYSYLKK